MENMRFLHTADWHLGRTLHGADLTHAFENWADHVVELVATQDIDALLVSGDVYDRGIPPVEMVDLLADTLERALEFTNVIVTSGNHDSARRLGFGSRLMREGLYFYTDSLNSHVPVQIAGSNGQSALIYPIPYLDPDSERGRLAEDPSEPLDRSHAAVLGRVLENIRYDLASRGINDTSARTDSGQGNPAEPTVIIMSHSFVIGAEETDSERDISVGGAAQVSASLFDLPGVDYVALGHIHGPQKVGGNGPLMRYSGSPIPFSFSEENHIKSSVIMDTQADDPIELIPAPVYRKLATLEGTLDELLSSKYDSHRGNFLRINVTDLERPANLFAKLVQKFPYVLEHHHLTEATSVSIAELEAIRTEPLSVLREFFETSGGRELTDGELGIIRDTWEKIGQEA